MGKVFLQLPTEELLTSFLRSSQSLLETGHRIRWTTALIQQAIPSWSKWSWLWAVIKWGTARENPRCCRKFYLIQNGFLSESAMPKQIHIPLLLQKLCKHKRSRKAFISLPITDMLLQGIAVSKIRLTVCLGLNAQNVACCSVAWCCLCCYCPFSLFPQLLFNGNFFITSDHLRALFSLKDTPRALE